MSSRLPTIHDRLTVVQCLVTQGEVTGKRMMMYAIIHRILPVPLCDPEPGTRPWVPPYLIPRLLPMTRSP